MNELLRRFLLQAGLREDDVAARLGVDPKTVRRWLNGRVPYPHNRAAIADLLGAEEADLWPGASGTLTAKIRPDELRSVYPHRLAMPREVWTRFFGSARREIDILAYALFLAQDKGYSDSLSKRVTQASTSESRLEILRAGGARRGEEAQEMPPPPRSERRSRSTAQRPSWGTRRSACTTRCCTTRSIALTIS